MGGASFDRRCLESADLRHQVLHRLEALYLGGTQRKIDGRVRRGLWTRPFPEVFLMPGAGRSWETMAMAAQMWALPCALSFRSAAHVWEPGDASNDPIEITVDRCRKHPDVVVHRVRSLIELDIVQHRGFHLTSPTQTIVDLARSLAPKRLELVASRAFRLGLSHPRSLRDRVESMQWRGRQGRAALLQVLEGCAAGLLDSELEADTLAFLSAHGLEPPARQYRVARAGMKRRLDFAWPNLRIGIECDSRKWHGGYVDLDRDVGRNNFYIGAGWRVLIATKSRLRAPFAREVGELLAERRRELGLA